MKYNKDQLIKICDELVKFSLSEKTISFMQFFLTPFAIKNRLTRAKLSKLLEENHFMNDTLFYCKCVFVDKILKDKDLQETVPRGSLMRYLRMYDEYLKESEQTENLERNIALGVATLFTEDYSKEQIDGDFAKIHAENLAKRAKNINPLLKNHEFRNKKNA